MKFLSWRSISWVGLALSLASAAASNVSATAIPPGTFSAPPDLFVGSTTGTVLASTTSGFTSTTGSFTGSVTAEVISSPLNTYCAGCLNFIYAFTNSLGSKDAILRSTAADYTGFLTDVGFDLGPSLVGGLIAPLTVDRVSADTVGFNFLAPPVFAGNGTLDLVIETNATSYTTGTLSFIDSGVATVTAFAPSATPEPASLALMGTGIVFCARLLRRKKKKNAVAAITA